MEPIDADRNLRDDRDPSRNTASDDMGVTSTSRCERPPPAFERPSCEVARLRSAVDQAGQGVREMVPGDAYRLEWSRTLTKATHSRHRGHDRSARQERRNCARARVSTPKGARSSALIDCLWVLHKPLYSPQWVPRERSGVQRRRSHYDRFDLTARKFVTRTYKSMRFNSHHERRQPSHR